MRVPKKDGDSTAGIVSFGRSKSLVGVEGGIFESRLSPVGLLPNFCSNGSGFKPKRLESIFVVTDRNIPKFVKVNKNFNSPHKIKVIKYSPRKCPMPSPITNARARTRIAVRK